MNTIEKALDKLAAGQTEPSLTSPQTTAVAPEGIQAEKQTDNQPVNDAVSNTDSPVSLDSTTLSVSTVSRANEYEQAAVEPVPVATSAHLIGAEPRPAVQDSAAAEHGATARDSTKRNYVHIDLERLAEQNFVAIATERKQIYEEYRVIKRKLINNAFGALSSTLHHPNLILVSSTRPGEGKTFTSINLALSIALEQDKTVLLVDADVLRPNVSRTLGVKHPVGLTDYLSSDKYQVSDILLSTNVERLKVITAGRPHHLSTELLASDKMLELVAEFASRYRDRIVIFDAPPLLGVNETAVVAGMCGQAVVVLEENATRLHELEKALSLLPQDLAVGFVMNKSRQSLEQGYGYGYGYYAHNQ